MRHFIFVFILFFIGSCDTNKITHYTRNNKTITRLSKQGVVYFYIGNGLDLPPSYVRVKYYGFDGLLGGFLDFKSDKVIIWEKFGNFEQVGDTNQMVIRTFKDNQEYLRWKYSSNTKDTNIIEFSNYDE